MDDINEQTIVERNQQTVNSSHKGPPAWRSVRFMLAYFMFIGNAIIFLQRISFSMVIVCMVNQTALDIQHIQSFQENGDFKQNYSQSNFSTISVLENSTSSMYYSHFSTARIIHYNHPSITDSLNAYTDNQSSPSLSNDTKVTSQYKLNTTGPNKDQRPCERHLGTLELSSAREDGPFVWDKELQGLLLGSLYWGYMFFQIPAGYLIYFAGPKLVCGVSTLLISVLTMLLHPAAFLSPWLVFALRLAIGSSTSFAIPSFYAVWGKWAPSPERATLMNIAFCGQHVANALVFPLSALLCKYGFAGGWPSVFYVFGMPGVLWAVVWLIFTTDSPEKYRQITAEEKDYIVATRASGLRKNEKLSVPWVKILTAPCFWAVGVAHFTFAWGLFLFLSNLPLFMYEVMNFDIQSNGLYSMLPYIALGLFMLCSGFVSDYVMRRGILGKSGSRRFFCAASNIIPAVLLIIMSYLDCTQVAPVVALLTLAVGMSGLAFSGFLINPFDIAPRYAVSIMSLTNSFACIPGILTPYIVAEVTKDKTREQWQIIFFITAAIFVSGTIFFCVFVKTDVQPWAVSEDISENETHVLNVDPSDLKDCQTA